MDLIANAMDNLVKVGDSNITPQRVHTRITSLKENWEKFFLVHEAIGLAMTELSSSDRLHLQNHSYFSENLFSITHEFYLEAVEKMTVFLAPENAENGTIQRTPSTQTISQSSSQN